MTSAFFGADILARIGDPSPRPPEPPRDALRRLVAAQSDAIDKLTRLIEDRDCLPDLLRVRDILAALAEAGR
jgi:hypothetical protein